MYVWRYYNVEKEPHQKMNKKIYDEIATAIQAVVERVRHQCGQNSVGGNRMSGSDPNVVNLPST